MCTPLRQNSSRAYTPRPARRGGAGRGGDAASSSEEWNDLLVSSAGPARGRPSRRVRVRFEVGPRCPASSALAARRLPVARAATRAASRETARAQRQLELFQSLGAHERRFFVLGRRIYMRTDTARDGIWFRRSRKAWRTKTQWWRSSPIPVLLDRGQGRKTPSNTQHLLPRPKRRPDDRRHAARPHARPPLLQTGALP